MNLASLTSSNPFSDLSKYTSRLPCSKCTGILLATSLVALALIAYLAKKLVNSDLIQYLLSKISPDTNTAPENVVSKTAHENTHLHTPESSVPPQPTGAAAASLAVLVRPTQEEIAILNKAFDILKPVYESVCSPQHFTPDSLQTYTPEEEATFKKALNLTKELIAEKQKNPTHVNHELTKLQRAEIVFSGCLNIEHSMPLSEIYKIILPPNLVDHLSPDFLSSLPTHILSELKSRFESEEEPHQNNLRELLDRELAIREKAAHPRPTKSPVSPQPTSAAAMTSSASPTPAATPSAPEDIILNQANRLLKHYKKKSKGSIGTLCVKLSIDETTTLQKAIGIAEARIKALEVVRKKPAQMYIDWVAELKEFLKTSEIAHRIMPLHQAI